MFRIKIILKVYPTRPIIVNYSFKDQFYSFFILKYESPHYTNYYCTKMRIIHFSISICSACNFDLLLLHYYYYYVLLYISLIKQTSVSYQNMNVECLFSPIDAHFSSYSAEFSVKLNVYIEIILKSNIECEL